MEGVHWSKPWLKLIVPEKKMGKHELDGTTIITRLSLLAPYR